MIWQTGTNDAINKMPVERFSALLLRGIKELKRHGIDVVLMTPQYAPQFTDVANYQDYLEAMRRAGLAAGVPLFDRFDPSKPGCRTSISPTARSSPRTACIRPTAAITASPSFWPNVWPRWPIAKAPAGRRSRSWSPVSWPDNHERRRRCAFARPAPTPRDRTSLPRCRNA